MDPQTRQPYGQRPEDTAQKATEKVTHAAEDAKAKASEAIDTARQRTAEIGANASDKATDVMNAAGDRMSTLAQTVREKAPAEGRAGEVAATAAETLERSGRYLREADPNTVRMDLEQMIRQHPIESMLVGLGVGYLLARSMRR